MNVSLEGEAIAQPPETLPTILKLLPLIFIFISILAEYSTLV